MANILTAIKSIVEFTDLSIQNITDGSNRMNNMGEGLEDYIKSAFSDTLNETNKAKKIEKISKTFSYTGNKNNPPDMMLRGGDAIEVKKKESSSSSLQLNSSHPKSKLLATNTRINKTCAECENWNIKDLIYAVGYVKSKQLKSLWMVYGDCYAANDETYQKVEDKIKTSISNLGDLDINESTNELSGVRNIDPLNITYLRVRGMWIVENPAKVFDYVFEYDKSAKFQLVCLMSKNKYDSFLQNDRELLHQVNGLDIKDVKIRNPNNSADLLNAKLITYKVV
ncbi:MAG: NgoPII family restriction endonuclease [Candidatus Thioglobus sp.]|jgi:hypothetical protein|nr:NgoPII family restriction endonuclease [Candidatus Thioglobus sp.]